jgi:ABC-2 type transport system ATP-binding protein
MKSIVSCLLVFTGYFLVVAFLNAWLVNYDANVNYFFMNSDKLVNMFTWSYKIKYDYIWQFTKKDLTFTLYPLFWVLMYVVFIILVLVQWAVYFASYRIADDYHKLLLIKKMKGFKMFNIKKLAAKQKAVKPMYPEDDGLIRISNFTKIYEGSSVKAVDDFSLTVNGGEVYGFLGHNGAGKSTTIKSLVGIQTITEGIMSVCGFDVAKQPVEAKRNIGYVSDNHAVYEKLTGREYINYVADLYLVSEKERKERFDKYVTMFNLTDAIDKEIKGYSHGMKQKIVVIASLMHDPKIWVLDEPLTGLDPTSSFQIKECMRDHANRGNIVFFSSHVIEVVEKICDKICIIGRGKLIGEWDIKQLKEEGITLEELYMKYVSTQNLVTATDT